MQLSHVWHAWWLLLNQSAAYPRNSRGGWGNSCCGAISSPNIISSSRSRKESGSPFQSKVNSQRCTFKYNDGSARENAVASVAQITLRGTERNVVAGNMLGVGAVVNTAAVVIFDTVTGSTVVVIPEVVKDGGGKKVVVIVVGNGE